MFKRTDQPYPSDLASLTSLRFFAAFWILLFHYLLIYPPLKGLTGITDKGYLAVDFFFILSGFILTHVYIDELRAGRFSVRGFLVRRLARIYPIHFFTLILSAGLICLGCWLDLYRSNIPQYFNLKTFFANVFLVHSWGIQEELTFNKPSWSLSAEWFAYLLFPGLALLFLRLSPIRLVLISLVLSIGLWVYSNLYWARPISATFNMGHIRILPEFMLGMAVYLVGCRYALRRNSNITLGVFGGLILILSHLRCEDIFIILLFAIIVFFAADQDRHSCKNILTTPLLVYLGKASFSLYMVHFLLIEPLLVDFYLANKLGHGLEPDDFSSIWFGMFFLAFLFSVLTYHLIEDPARRWIIRRYEFRSPVRSGNRSRLSNRKRVR